MFGYVTPCIMELKIKDYEKFKAYYCGLCKTIKKDFGNLPRLTLNYDMTFLAVLLDSIDGKKAIFKREFCITHHIKKRHIITENDALSYAAFFNVTLAYYKLLDNVKDDASAKDRLYSLFLKGYFKNIPQALAGRRLHIEEMLNTLYNLEAHAEGKSIDELAHPFADLTGYILSSYKEDNYTETLYWLGYNLGKWIYIIDAFDDLEKDMDKSKFNAINNSLNSNNLSYEDFYKSVEDRVDFTLVTSAEHCLQYLNKLPLKKNKPLLYNILQYGLLEKMDIVFKRSVLTDEKSI